MPGFLSEYFFGLSFSISWGLSEFPTMWHLNCGTDLLPGGLELPSGNFFSQQLYLPLAASNCSCGRRSPVDQTVSIWAFKSWHNSAEKASLLEYSSAWSRCHLTTSHTSEAGRTSNYMKPIQQNSYDVRRAQNQSDLNEVAQLVPTQSKGWRQPNVWHGFVWLHVDNR